MAAITSLTPALAVAGALTAADFEEIARQGFKTVINNRPDGEEPGQLTAREEAALARRAGLVYQHVPAAKHEVLDDHVLEPMADALAQASGPVLLHCRSGLRSTMMWAAVSVETGASLSEVLAIAKAAGFDLDIVKDEIAQRAGNRPTNAAKRPPQQAAA